MDDFATGYMAGQDSGGGSGGGWGGFGEGIWAVIILAILFGRGGFGGLGGGGGCGCGGGCATQADLAAGFNNSAVLSSLNDIKLGQANAINYNNQGFTGLNTALMQGFHGVDNAVCTIGHQISDCCCQTQRAIDGVKYDMATGFCGLGNTINGVARDIIDNQNANYRGLMDFLVSEKLASKDAQISDLRLRASQADQNAVIRAAIDASTAEILRRTGHDCPSAAYLVQPPTPVSFPVNGCGTVQFGGWGNNYGGNGCGCGCGCG